MNSLQLQQALTEKRNALLHHPLYKVVESPFDLQLFMQHHVFAVWDFMSLLKALQQQLTCTKTPWFPIGDPQHRYLINEIVLAEETDINKFGVRQSHFEMYLDAMQKAGASTQAVEDFLSQVQHGTDVFLIIAKSELPASVKSFLQFTFHLIDEAKVHKIAAAFTYGREELIPDMFTSIIKEIQRNFPEEDLSLLTYYFERHIELDGDEHGPMALQLVAELCGDSAEKWQEAEECAKEALQLRKQLWDGIYKAINFHKAIA